MTCGHSRTRRPSQHLRTYTGTFAALQAFFALDARARLRDVAREDLRAQEEQYQQTQGLYRDGLKGLADLYKSETEWHASEIRLVASLANYKSAQQPFNSLLGLSPWTAAELSTELEPGATDLPLIEEDAARLSERRPEIARARSATRRKRPRPRTSR